MRRHSRCVVSTGTNWSKRNARTKLRHRKYFAAVWATFMWFLVAPVDGNAQSPVYTLQEFGVRLVLSEGAMRPEVYWEIEMLQDSERRFTASLRQTVDPGHTINLREGGASKSYAPATMGQTITDSVIDTMANTGALVHYRLTIRTDVDNLGHHHDGNEDSRFRVMGAPTAAPPTIIHLTSAGANGQSFGFRVEWDELADGLATGYSAVTGYELQYRFRDEDDWTAVAPFASGAPRTHDHMLTRAEALDGEFRYRIRANNEFADLANGPHGQWSEALSPTVTADLNGDGGVGADDMLALYYHLAMGDGFVVGTDRNTATAGPQVKFFLGSLLRSAEVTDAEVLAAWDRAILLEKFEGGVIGGVSAADAGVDADDALILYYVADFRQLLGDGYRGGFPSMRAAILTDPSGLTMPTDQQLQEMLQRASGFLASKN